MNTILYTLIVTFSFGGADSTPQETILSGYEEPACIAMGKRIVLDFTNSMSDDAKDQLKGLESFIDPSKMKAVWKCEVMTPEQIKKYTQQIYTPKETRT
jgi:hypothetical protein